MNSSQPSQPDQRLNEDDAPATQQGPSDSDASLSSDGSEPSDPLETPEPEAAQPEAIELEQPYRSYWIPVLIILGGLFCWMAYHATGMVISAPNWTTGILKAVIVLGSFSLFFGLWLIALRARAGKE